MTLLKHKVLKGDIVFTEGESQMRGHGFKLFKTEVCQISSHRDWFLSGILFPERCGGKLIRSFKVEIDHFFGKIGRSRAMRIWQREV